MSGKTQHLYRMFQERNNKLSMKMLQQSDFQNEQVRKYAINVHFNQLN